MKNGAYKEYVIVGMNTSLSRQLGSINIIVIGAMKLLIYL